MAPLILSILLFTFFVTPLMGFIMNKTDIVFGDITSSPIHPRDSHEVTDLNWIERWAAVGDSYTAGIGAGSLYGGSSEDKACSRYDQSYPVVLNRLFGPGVKSFSFKACSGAQTNDIKQQIRNLDEDMDLVVLTAGGNDLCLSSIISRCVMLPVSMNKCHESISHARDGITSVLVPHVQDLLMALRPKMKKGGIVILVLYAQFFSVEDEDCAKKQDWTFLGLRTERFKLSTGRRREFNDLVVDVNNALQEMVAGFRQEDHDFYVRTANWDSFVGDYKGRFCEPGSSGEYPDPFQPNLQFFKGFTKRDLEKDIGTKRSFQSEIDPPPLARNATITSNPNEKGHITIASYVLEAIYAARSVRLDLPQPICHLVDNFQCNAPNERKDLDASRRYVDKNILNDSYKKFCKEIHPFGIDWTAEETMDRGTPEEHTYLITTRNGVNSYDKEECLDSFDKIVNSCKTYDHLWKYGGYHEENNHRYQLSITNGGYQRLPRGPIKTTCEAKRHGAWTHYKLKGYGGVSGGRNSLNFFGAIKVCVTTGSLRKKIYTQFVRDWDFYYSYDEGHKEDPVPEGYEWQVNFRAPAGHMKSCFGNNFVQHSVGLVCILSLLLF
ncbi:SGNH hydrolase [Aspergillus taichungensis]|uniref:SGNH hydrolase n=1 Tax=Aspergillus taichungensis TaxID=482145 RepID=A0A2J5HT49_9EURO|nr:SGNH hydrolase [Aspergillus taichungensis]